MSRLFALAAVALFAAAATADDWTDKGVKLRAETKLGTKQAGGLLRDGATLRQGQPFTVKSDDGTYLELVGQTGFLFKTETDLFDAREMPKKVVVPKADAKDLWAAGTRVLPKRPNRDIQFGDRDADGKAIYYELTGVSQVVLFDNGDDWVRVRDRAREGWAGKDDFVTKADAAGHFDKVVKANPTNSWALFMRAAAWHEAGKFDAAADDYTEYIRRNPNERSAYNNRANAWIAKKEFDKAIADCTESIRLAPDFALPYSNRANALLGKKEHEKALADADKALELDPKFAQAAVFRARALVGLKRSAEAAQGFEAAAKLDPTAARLNALAWFLATCPDEKGRDPKKAVEAATKAVEKAGKDVLWSYRDTLAAAYADAGDFEKAVAEQTKALEDKTPGAEERKKMEARLELYKSKKPYRDE